MNKQRARRVAAAAKRDDEDKAYIHLHRFEPGRAGRPLRKFKKGDLVHINKVQSKYMTLSGKPYRSKPAPSYRGQYPSWHSEKTKSDCKTQKTNNKGASEKVRSLAV